MKILAIETTGKYGSASVADDAGNVYSASSCTEMDHLKGMIFLIDEAIGKAGISKKELTHIAASRGPGSFTGIRIGVTTARTMAQMLGIPCIGVSSLEAMALRAADAARLSGADVIVPVINARRGQTYAGAWSTELMEPGRAADVLEERQYMIDELTGLLRGRRAFFTGDGTEAYAEEIQKTMPEGSYFFADESIRYQHSETVALSALARAAAGETLGYDELLPEYMRLAEAEQKLRAGTLSDRIKKPMV